MNAIAVLIVSLTFLMVIGGMLFATMYEPGNRIRPYKKRLKRVEAENALLRQFWIDVGAASATEWGGEELLRERIYTLRRGIETELYKTEPPPLT